MKLASGLFLSATLACLCAPVQSLEVGNGHGRKRFYNDLVAIAQIAQGVYKKSAAPSGWEVRKAVENFGGWGQKDHMGIYGKKNSGFCALAISGSNDALDWTQNLDVRSKWRWRNVAWHVHSGFAGEADGYLKGNWKHYKDKLRSSDCGGGIAVVGHSLGGATASLLAGYGNTQNAFAAKYLYTFGAPAVSRWAIRNKKVSNKCFAGARIYNKDGSSGDPVPAAAIYAGFAHPFVQQVQLYDKSSVNKWSCTEGHRWPHYVGHVDINKHYMDAYVPRLQVERQVFKDLAPHIGAKKGQNIRSRPWWKWR